MMMTKDDLQEEAIQILLTSLPYDLDVRGIRFLAEGWDNRIYAADGDTLLRVAKNDDASRQLLREANLLRRIAPLLTLPVPVPEFIHHAERGGPVHRHGVSQAAGDLARRGRRRMMRRLNHWRRLWLGFSMSCTRFHLDVVGDSESPDSRRMNG